MAEETVMEYRPSPTGAKFHASNAFVRGLMGPVGSGKTVTCVTEMVRVASFQKLVKKSGKAKRRSRWAVIRNTYPELENTTLATFMDWFGDMAKVVYKHPIEVTISDGDLHVEFLFIALDRPEHVKKLKSLELTGAFINEASEIPEAILKMLRGRVARYPAKRDGGSVFPCIIMDTNPPDDDHWWYRLAEQQKPHNHEFFRQPPAMLKMEMPGGKWAYIPNPDAENIDNHSKGYNYYYNLIQGADDQFINVFVLGQYGTTADGRAVYSQYNDIIHVRENLKVYPGRDLLIGTDFGLTPAAVIGQQGPTGQVRILREVVTEIEAHGVGFKQFVRDMLKPVLNQEFPGMTVRGWGDPAGSSGAESDASSCFQAGRDEGLHLVSAPGGNALQPRIESVNKGLTTFLDGQPGFVIDGKGCPNIRKGFNGRYMYERVQIANTGMYKDQPAKNHYSHVHDALQNLCKGIFHIESKSRVVKRQVVKVGSGGWT